MTSDKSSSVVPKRRFPEFLETPAWSVEPLGCLFRERQETGLPELRLLSVTDREGVIPQEQTHRKNISNSNKAKYLRVVPGDIAYNTMRMWEGRSARVGMEGVVSPAYTVCQPSADTNSDFFAYYFKTGSLIRQFRKYSQGLVKDTLNLKYEAFSRIPVGFPPPEEQKKIADCLGSLDDLIAAEGRKLEALRQHKKGLMQQLFPQPGETVPNLRFPEFRSAGDWHFQQLSDITEPISERVGTSKCVPLSVTTGVGLLSQEEKFGRIIAGNSYKNYIRLQTNDLAYNKSATKEFPQGYIARYSGTRDAAVPNSIFVCFRPDAAVVIPEYLDHLFHGNHHGRWLRKYITVGARAHGALSVSDDALMSMPVPLPPVAVSLPEERKIADCLGSLDDLIEAEGGKLETLKQHKRGLLQQLFPKMETA